MTDKVVPVSSATAPDAVVIEAEPQPLEIDLKRVAIVVVDMQNAYMSKGGMADILNWGDPSSFQHLVAPVKELTDKARSKGIKVVYIVTKYSPDMREGGNPNSPAWYKGRSIAYREHPEWGDRFVTEGTWGAQVIDELKPQEGDIVVEKSKYSAFFGTSLDIVLRSLNIKYLIFTGVAANICVESTLRDAFYLDYFCILASDATAGMGPSFTTDTSLYNVKTFYGWVAPTDNIIKAF